MQILLAANAGIADEAIAASVQTSGSTIYRTRKRFVEISLAAALSGEPRPGAARKLSGKQEAQLVALACSDPPEGCARWTLKLLVGALVEVIEHPSVSRETIRRRLDDNDLKPWQQKMWCIAKIDGEYISRMEDLLDLYAEPHDLKQPVVCFDESPIQLIGEVRVPITPNLESDTATTPSTSATARQTSLSRSTPTARGARSRPPIGAPTRTSPSACANSSTSTIPRPTRSAS
jgi:transposase